VSDTTAVQATRRQFLQASGASSLVIGFALPQSGRVAAGPAAFSPNAYLRIAPDNRVTVVCGSSEMGQGVLTSIPMLVAEELDADGRLAGVDQAPVSAAFNNPMFGMQATGGSTTVRAHWEPMRNAGAAAREMLVAAAAAQWKAGADRRAGHATDRSRRGQRHLRRHRQAHPQPAHRPRDPEARLKHRGLGRYAGRRCNLPGC
jgi:isoquinoline 1-oxidoreductase beta subunit